MTTEKSTPTMRDPDKDHAYTKPRLDVAALVGGRNMRILDLGCSTGALGAELLRRGATVVDGVEIDPAAADVARKYLGRVVTGSVDEVDFDELGNDYDVVIAADVLEHVADPWQLLQRISTLLAPGGRVVASIPNVRYWYVVADLALRGRFEYQDAGVLDRTHLRFFTRKSITDLFTGAGYAIDSLEPNRFPHRGLKALAARALGDMAHVQFLVVARPGTMPHPHE